MSGYKVEICGVNTAKLPLLSNEEKEELFQKILDGDMEAREQYIKGNLRLVLSVIQRFSNSQENIDDLFQIAQIRGGTVNLYSFFTQNLHFKPVKILERRGWFRPPVESGYPESFGSPDGAAERGSLFSGLSCDVKWQILLHLDDDICGVEIRTGASGHDH